MFPPTYSARATAASPSVSYWQENRKISIHFGKILEMNFKNLIGVDKMLQFFIGFILGAMISLFLYACIIAGAEYDKKLYGEEAKREWRWRN